MTIEYPRALANIVSAFLMQEIKGGGADEDTFSGRCLEAAAEC